MSREYTPRERKAEGKPEKKPETGPKKPPEVEIVEAEKVPPPPPQETKLEASNISLLKKTEAEEAEKSRRKREYDLAYHKKRYAEGKEPIQAKRREEKIRKAKAILEAEERKQPAQGTEKT